MAELQITTQAITQAAIKAAKAAVRPMIEVSDHEEYSVSIPISGPKQMDQN